MMVPDCQRRLQKACEDLRSVLETEQELSEAEEYVSAKSALADAAPQLPESASLAY